MGWRLGVSRVSDQQHDVALSNYGVHKAHKATEKDQSDRMQWTV